MLLEQASQQKAAKVAGISLLIMAILGPFAYLFVFQSLVVYDNAAETALNIMDSQGLFRAAIVSLVIVVILDVIVAWSLYIVFEPFHRNLSLLAASFRIVYAAMFGVAVFQNYNALKILSDAEYLVGWELTERYNQAMLYINAFNNGWNISLIIFGIHLLILGYLVFKSLYFPKFLGGLIIIAGLGYLIDSLALILFGSYSFELSVYTFIGELLLIIWLFIRGRNGFPS
ncbi:DUF4386 domain-containing protein [Piscibacillus halophilus]|uniref:DUF4386 domain-containing protein n=1 Tax=Piscibacillus halophilus TaxID=571933 RepID=A0A1H9F9P5_9BACI|nr:DUF4386 domain-containing protein [Piscibacillus halophilus]SEQ34018.1 protein of unknown function [Piscibacillus halophilus]